MDLTDILFSKPFIGSGGGGGGGSNVETATIVITVTDGTAAITSGAFPDWFTAANNDYISGQVTCPDYPKEVVEGTVAAISLRTVLYVIQEGEGFVGAVSLGFSTDTGGIQIREEIDFGFMDGKIVLLSEGEPVGSGTYTITLKYIPEA